MSNSIDFYKRILLHVIPARIIVPWLNGTIEYIVSTEPVKCQLIIKKECNPRIAHWLCNVSFFCFISGVTGAFTPDDYFMYLSLSFFYFIIMCIVNAFMYEQKKPFTSAKVGWLVRNLFTLLFTYWVVRNLFTLLFTYWADIC